MARNERRKILQVQLTRLDKALMTASATELTMLESLRSDIEKELSAMRPEVQPRPQAA